MRSNLEEEGSEEAKGLGTKEEGEKPQAGMTPSEQDEEKSKEIKKAVMEQETELGAKNEVAANPETSGFSSNPEEKKLEGMNVFETEQKKENEEKNEEAEKQRMELHQQK